MILVALAILLSTAAGVASERRTPRAMRAAELSLTAMLYVLMPFVAYASFAHLHLSFAGASGLVVAWIGLGATGLLAWRIGRWMRLPRPSLGGLICTVTIVNTGYVGLPLIVVLLGARALTPGVAYDQAVSAPFFFTAGFAIGAAFGVGEKPPISARIQALLFRNPPLAGAVAGLLVVGSRLVVDALIVPGFFAVGVYLSADPSQRLLERPGRPVLVALALRFGVNSALLEAVSVAGVAIPSVYLFQAVMPAGLTSLILGRRFGLDQGLIATVIVWSTIAVLAGATTVYLV